MYEIQELLDFPYQCPVLMAHDVGDDLDAEHSVVLIIGAHKLHEQVDDLLSIGLEGLGRGLRSGQPMEYLEHAVSELLEVRLLRGVGLEDAWLPEDVDEGGHESLEEGWVSLAGGVVVEIIA
jgi:hypothetical protein